MAISDPLSQQIKQTRRWIRAAEKRGDWNSHKAYSRQLVDMLCRQNMVGVQRDEEGKLKIPEATALQFRQFLDDIVGKLKVIDRCDKCGQEILATSIPRKSMEN